MDQIASEPFMDNGQKAVSGHFERLFDIAYCQWPFWSNDWSSIA